MTGPAPQEDPAEAAPGGGSMVRWIIGLVANITVITALLVYFGWQRDYVMAGRIGIDEDVLGQSTRDYLLRSVGPALTLLLTVAACGLAWLQFDRLLAARLRSPDPADRPARVLLIALSAAWIAMPAAAWLLGQAAAGLDLTALRELMFVLWPFSIGGGLLLTYYGSHLRGTIPEGRDPLFQAMVLIVVLVTLFWGTSNYATLRGYALAESLADGVHRLSAVTVYSQKRLFLSAPGVTETPLTGKNAAYSYRYAGLRLLARSGGRSFLVADSWSPGNGPVMVLSEKDPLRMEFSKKP
ncbi:hypothetical protein [Actinocorallia longicatena]|uniref:DUF5671 domain-containing protein n=1 Tax=Actinocorallia longicatena TaxID=111803 RepID=A0ABP6QBZ1_9ACTN